MQTLPVYQEVCVRHAGEALSSASRIGQDKVRFRPGMSIIVGERSIVPNGLLVFGAQDVLMNGWRLKGSAGCGRAQEPGPAIRFTHWNHRHSLEV